jgi:hypothetical protein
LVSESYVTIFAPPLFASCSAPQIASLSLADTTITSVCCCDSVLMYDTCADGDASDGPVSLYVPLNSSTATLPPLLSEVSKYGLLTCLGRKATFRPSLMVPEVLPVPEPEPEPASVPESSAHAAVVSAIAASTAAAVTRTRLVLMLVSFQRLRGLVVAGAAIRGSCARRWARRRRG